MTVAGILKVGGLGLALATSSRVISAIVAGARRPREARYARIMGEEARENSFFTNQQCGLQ